MSGLLFRTAQPEDAAAVNLLVADGRRTYTSPEHGVDENWQQNMYSRLTSIPAIWRCARDIVAARNIPGKNLFVVAEDQDQQLQAVISADIHPFTEHGGNGEMVREINRLFVCRGLRKMGVGRRLLSEYLDWEHQPLQPQLPTVVAVVDYNKPARRLYELHGFDDIPDSQFEHDGLPLLWMRLNPNAQPDKRIQEGNNI
ncbi:MAG TPA: GNAT family N-acetyltransferase [Candidatus Saccharimonadales bacterium]